MNVCAWMWPVGARDALEAGDVYNADVLDVNASDFNEDGYVDASYPNVIATGDFNRDGHADFATSYLVRFGDGAGNFPSSQVVPGMTDHIAQIDFNNDLFIDFLTPQELLLNRDGVFVGGFDKMGTLGSRAGDLNGDSLVDMAGIIYGDDATYLTLFLGVPPG